MAIQWMGCIANILIGRAKELMTAWLLITKKRYQANALCEKRA